MKPTGIYVVEDWSYDGVRVHGYFSSRALAEAYVAERAAGEWPISEPSVFEIRADVEVPPEPGMKRHAVVLSEAGEVDDHWEPHRMRDVAEWRESGFAFFTWAHSSDDAVRLAREAMARTPRPKS